MIVLTDLSEQKCIKLAAKMNSTIAMSFEINTLLSFNETFNYPLCWRLEHFCFSAAYVLFSKIILKPNI